MNQESNLTGLLLYQVCNAQFEPVKHYKFLHRTNKALLYIEYIRTHCHGCKWLPATLLDVSPLHQVLTSNPQSHGLKPWWTFNLTTSPQANLSGPSRRFALGKGTFWRTRNYSVSKTAWYSTRLVSNFDQCVLPGLDLTLFRWSTRNAIFKNKPTLQNIESPSGSQNLSKSHLHLLTDCRPSHTLEGTKM